MKKGNTLHLEIEQKYNAQEIDWDDFVSIMKAFKPYKQLHVAGQDTYYQCGKIILRWRQGKDKNEVTIKKRKSKKSAFVRVEIDWDLSGNSDETIKKGLKAMGYKKLFSITKVCAIFWFKKRNGKVSIVLYDVFSSGFPKRRFLEIEADKGQDHKASKKLVRSWEKALGLTKKQRVNESLYELYSGRKTPMEKP